MREVFSAPMRTLRPIALAVNIPLPAVPLPAAYPFRLCHSPPLGDPLNLSPEPPVEAGDGGVPTRGIQKPGNRAQIDPAIVHHLRDALAPDQVAIQHRDIGIARCDTEIPHPRIRLSLLLAL